MSATARRSLFVALILALLAPSAAAESFPWQTLSIDEALAKAKADGLPLLVDVYAVWCEPCKRLDRLVFGSDEVRALSGRFIAIRVDGEQPEGEAVRTRFGVQRYPTSLFIGKDGKEWGRIVGFRELPGYLATLQSFLGGGSPDPQPAPSVAAGGTLRDRFEGAFRRAVALEPEIEPELRRLADTSPKDDPMVGEQATLALAELLVSRDRPADAVPLLDSLVRRSAGSAVADDAAYVLARAHARLGDPGRGLKILATQARRSKNGAEAAYRLARFCTVTTGVQPGPAIKALERALRGRPDADFLLDALAGLHASRGELEAARESLRRAAALRPDLPYYGERLAELDAAPGPDVTPGTDRP